MAMQVLIDIPYETLMELCKHNDTVKNICNDDGFWMDKIYHDFSTESEGKIYPIDLSDLPCTYPSGLQTYLHITNPHNALSFINTNLHKLESYKVDHHLSKEQFIKKGICVLGICNTKS